MILPHGNVGKNRMVERIFESELTNMRTENRPRLRWINSVKENLRCGRVSVE